MAAKTGLLTIGLAPHPANYILNLPQAEKAAQTFKTGAVLQLSSGYLIGSTTGTLSTGYGIAMNPGQDLASDGAAKASIYRFAQGQMVEGTMNGTFAQTDIGLEATIAQASGGIPTFTQAGSSGTFRIIGLADGWNVGDTNARIIAIPMDSFIEQGGGNE